MQISSLASLVGLLASMVAASPIAGSTSAAGLEKRIFEPGRCRVHLTQRQRRNNCDTVRFEIFDNRGERIGDHEYEIAIDKPVKVSSYLPAYLRATQPNQSHDVNMEYLGYEFGNHGGCSIGGWDKGVRQWDCEFACEDEWLNGQWPRDDIQERENNKH